MLQQVGSVGFVDACQLQFLAISIIVPSLKATNSTLKFFDSALRDLLFLELFNLLVIYDNNATSFQFGAQFR